MVLLSLDHAGKFSSTIEISFSSTKPVMKKILRPASGQFMVAGDPYSRLFVTQKTTNVVTAV
jgi:hypothetical protein